MHTQLAMLWHHHQPDYRDPDTGRPVMPWTRLHGLRGYRDVAVALLESGCPMTVNLVPSLLDQLLHYEVGGDDPHLELSRAPADGLSGDQRAQILGSFVAGHPTMFERHAASRRLKALRDEGATFAVGELRDLQVWSTLAWVGWSGLRDEPVLAALQDKASGFSEADKELLFAACARLLEGLLPLYRELASQGQAELSASAYYHPILPLVIDPRHGKRCLPELPLDELPDWPGASDALLQLRRGRLRVEEVLQARVTGLWPSEGSISPELIEPAAAAGFQWLVSDEGNLHRSRRDKAANDAPWELGHGVTGFFRDRELSDAIGFRYATRPAEQAVDELLHQAAQRGGLVTVALDGENPWESFPDAGEAFFKRLCASLMDGGPVRATTFSRARQELEPAGRVHHLHTGSWINSNFAIWIGDPEDRAGWRALGEARAAVAEAGDPEEALEHLLSAEGSDWFWWYGQEFSTPFALAFDDLFRRHLSAAWRALGREPPAHLKVPIKRPTPAARAGAAAQRLGPRTPELRAGQVLRWIGAASAPAAPPEGAMALSERRLNTLRWARHPDGVLLRLQHRELGAPGPTGSRWQVVGGPESLEFPADTLGSPCDGVVVGAEATELWVPLPAGHWGPLQLLLIRDGKVLDRYPRSEPLAVPEPRLDWWV